MISSPQAEIQKLIYDTLSASTALAPLVEGIYDMVPPDPWGTVQGYVSFGPTQVVNDDAECLVNQDHYIQIDCWSRQHSVHCKRMVDTVAAALNNAPLALSDNGLIGITVENRQVLRDPDGLTAHGILSVKVMVEEMP